MGKFKIGDRVKIRFDAAFGRDSVWGQGRQVGTVIEVREYGSWPVRVDFPGEGAVPCAPGELELAPSSGPYAGVDKPLKNKTKLQLVQIIENQKAEITKLAKEIEGLKNLKPAIAVQPVQAGQLVETVKRTRPKVGEQIFWAKHELKVGDIIGGFCTNVGEYEVTGPWIEGPWGHYPVKKIVKKTLGDGWGGFQANHDGGWKMIRPVDAPKIPPLPDRYKWIKRGVRSKVNCYHIFTSDPYYANDEWVVDCKAESYGYTWTAYRLSHWYNAKPEPKIPPLDPKKAWIKKDGTGTIGSGGYGWHYKFTSDPRYDDARGSWIVDVVVIEKDGRQSASYPTQLVNIDWQPYTPEKPKTFWDLVKVGDKIKVPLMYCGKVDRTYTGRVHLVDRAGLSVQVSFIVDTVEGASIWKPGQKASIYKGTFDLGACEILKD